MNKKSNNFVQLISTKSILILEILANKYLRQVCILSQYLSPYFFYDVQGNLVTYCFILFKKYCSSDMIMDGLMCIYVENKCATFSGYLKVVIISSFYTRIPSGFRGLFVLHNCFLRPFVMIIHDITRVRCPFAFFLLVRKNVA